MGIILCSDQGRSYMERSFCLSLHYRRTVITIYTVQFRFSQTLFLTGIPGYPYHPKFKDRHCSIPVPLTFLFLSPTYPSDLPTGYHGSVTVPEKPCTSDKSQHSRSPHGQRSQVKNKTHQHICLAPSTAHPKKPNCGHCGTFMSFDPCARIQTPPISRIVPV